ncbi:hypothetical protein AALC25_10135 [Lachnospiraceae bacterium 29-84]
MDIILEELHQNIEMVESIVNKIEGGDAYMADLRGYLPLLNQLSLSIFEEKYAVEVEKVFFLQILDDVVSGIENEDSVLLLDVLRYGLLEVYYYMATEYQSEEQNE